MLRGVGGRGAGSAGSKRDAAEGASCAFIHSLNVYEVFMCIGAVLSTVVTTMSKTPLTSMRLVGEEIIITGCATCLAGPGKHFPTRGHSMCKGQESRAQDTLD